MKKEKMINGNNNEEIDITQYEAFRSPESLEAFIRDLEEQEERFRNGTEELYTIDEVEAFFEEKFRNAEIQNNLSRRSAKGA
ncbi:MAG: hypothetical protein IK093_13065 [Ruminiclostridium sp.]|nr:hypothetical protein [Ruminiclostridium sp.]